MNVKYDASLYNWKLVLSKLHDCNIIIIEIQLFLMQNLELCILPSAGLAKQIVNKPRRTHVVIFIVTINTKDFIWIIMISMSFNEIYYFLCCHF